MDIVLNRYTKGPKFARGGLGDLYKGQDLVTGKVVAIKHIRPSAWAEAGIRQKIEQGVETVINLRHRNLLRVYGAGLDGSAFYVVTEYVNGYGLDRILSRVKRLAPEVAAFVVSEVCAGLAYAFSNGMMAHRDIKPSNIMIAEGGRVVLTDFDTARPEQSHLDRSIVLMTKRYVAPEVARGARGDERSDIFSLGVVLYEAITGAYPFVKNALFIGDLTGDDTPQPSVERPRPMQGFCPEVGAGLDRVVFSTLAGDSDSRYASVTELRQNLAPFASEDAAEVVALLGAGDFEGAIRRELADAAPEDALSEMRQAYREHSFYRSPPAEQHRGFVLARNGKDAQFPLKSGMKMGRSAACDVALGDASVSRLHARMVAQEGQWWVEDLNSRNGVQINGARIVERQVVKDGDLIQIGKVALMFVAPKAAMAAPVNEAETMIPLAQGDRIEGGYTLLTLLEQSPHSSVFLAGRDGEDAGYIVYFLGEHLSRRPEAAERFHRLFETRMAQHMPDIARIEALGKWRNNAYAISEKPAGMPLAEALGQPGIGLQERMRWGRAVARIFQALGEMDVVWGTVSLDDFAIREADGSVVLCNRRFSDPGDYASLSPYAVCGISREYLIDAPEGRHCDLYSLGAILYEVVTGRCPFPGDNIYEVESRKLKGILQPVTDLDAEVPQGVADLIHTLLHPHPEERPGADDAVRTLDEALAGCLPDFRISEGLPVSVLLVLLDAIVSGSPSDRMAAVRSLLQDFARYDCLPDDLDSEADAHLIPWAREMALALRKGGAPVPCDGEAAAHSCLVRALSTAVAIWTGTWDAETFWACLHLAEPGHRVCALWALFQVGAREKLDLFVERIRQAPPGTVSAAEIRMLSAAGYSLLDGGGDFEAHPPEAREALVGSISLLCDSALQERYYQCAMADREEVVRAAGVRTLGAQKDPRWLFLLLKGLEDRAERVRSQAIAALGEIGWGLRRPDGMSGDSDEVDSEVACGEKDNPLELA